MTECVAGAEMFNVLRCRVVCDVKCNLNPNYVNTAALAIWNVAGKHTRTKPMAHNFTHTEKAIKESREEKMGLEGRFK